MSQAQEILLGNACHTLYSDEVWYLIVPAGSPEILLEARFDSDAPERSGTPVWLRTEFCVSGGPTGAVCRVPYTDPAHLLSASRLSFVPEAIWTKALAECGKLGR